MLVSQVPGVQQPLGAFNIDIDIDPVLGGTATENIDSFIRKPLVNRIQCFGLWLDKIIYFFVAQVLAVTRVVWVRDYSNVQQEAPKHD